MDAQTFLGLETTDNPLRYRLPVTRSLSTWSGFLFGGSALGAAITAMELTTNRPIVWATAQYLSYAHPGDVVELEVVVSSSGRRTSQARVVARVGDVEICTVTGALGRRADEVAATWARFPPDLPEPTECPVLEHLHDGESVASQFDRRLVLGRGMDMNGDELGEGNTRLWIRPPAHLDMSAAALAVLGDYVPMGVRHALGDRAGGGTSLDNTLRVVHLVPSEWVLSDIFVHAVANGFAHGRVHLWSSDGTLLAIASQSTIVRWRNNAA